MATAKQTFIVIDGVDGSGKSTLIKNLAALIEKRTGRAVHLTREPGGSPFAEEVRKLILPMEPGARIPSPEEQFGLVWAARWSHLTDTVLPALRRGDVVITDRYDSSTYAYQICGDERESLLSPFLAMQSVYEQLVKPTCYVLVDVSPETARARLHGRSEKLNHFDLKGPEFHARVREGMKEFSEMVDSAFVISGEPSPEDLAENAYKHVLKYL